MGESSWTMTRNYRRISHLFRITILTDENYRSVNVHCKQNSILLVRDERREDKENCLIEHKQTKGICRHRYRIFISTSLMCSIIERTDIDRLLVPFVVASLLSRRREGVTISREQWANDCLQLFDHDEHTWESHFQADDERHQLITYRYA